MTFPSLLFHFLSPSKIYHMKQNYPTEKKKKGGEKKSTHGIHATDPVWWCHNILQRVTKHFRSRGYISSG